MSAPRSDAPLRVRPGQCVPCAYRPWRGGPGARPLPGRSTLPPRPGAHPHAHSMHGPWAAHWPARGLPHHAPPSLRAAAVHARGHQQDRAAQTAPRPRSWCPTPAAALLVAGARGYAPSRYNAPASPPGARWGGGVKLHCAGHAAPWGTHRRLSASPRHRDTATPAQSVPASRPKSARPLDVVMPAARWVPRPLSVDLERAQRCRHARAPGNTGTPSIRPFQPL